jgi:hypothetical protein
MMLLHFVFVFFAVGTPLITIFISYGYAGQIAFEITSAAFSFSQQIVMNLIFLKLSSTLVNSNYIRHTSEITEDSSQIGREAVAVRE